MKLLVLGFALCFSTMAFAGEINDEAAEDAVAETSSVAAATLSAPSESLLSEQRLLSTSFSIGRSSVRSFIPWVNGGDGLNLGARIDFWQTVGLGLDADAITSNPGPADETVSSFMYLSPYISANVIQFAAGPVNINGAMTLGIWGGARQAETYESFIGASLDLIYRRKIGVRFDTKNSTDNGALNSLALVGYY